jgi:putative GTP pyrophosphokinase
MIRDSRQFRRFLEEYQEYVIRVLHPTRDELKKILDRWRESDYWGKYSDRSRLPSPSPVQRVFVRIKRPESVVNKIIRKPGDFPNGLSPESFVKMNDALGARVIAYFLSQLPIIDKEVRSSELLELSSDPRPVAYLRKDLIEQFSLSHMERLDKESGYASIHYFIRLRESSVPDKNRPLIELQVRTMAEDLWGEIEHILGYKPEKRTSFAVKKQFQILSKQIAAIDEHLNFLNEELLRFQKEVTYKDSDPLNAENLPPVLAECSIGCAQKEIDGLLKILFSRGVSTVGDLRGIASPSRLERIRNVYRSEKGRAPIDFEVVANLATVSGATDTQEEINLIKTQIAYLDAWDNLRKGLNGKD